MAHKTPQEFRAICGHRDTLGYFAGTVCARCARRGHAAATGKRRVRVVRS